MVIRKPYAAQFYRGDCKAQMESFRSCYTPPSRPPRIVAGIVPHAGWFFSGAAAAKVFFAIRDKGAPKTFILLGAVHLPVVRRNSLYSYGAWDTPLGPVEVDEALSDKLMDGLPDILFADNSAHLEEHSIEVQVPMIKYLFPGSRIVPIAVPPGEDAVELGGRIGLILNEEGIDAVVIGSSDLTHYGDNYGFSPAGYGRDAYAWMIKNDQRVIDLALRLEARRIIPEAARNYNACGAGAMAATVAAAKVLGSGEGVLLEHTTSYEVYSEGGFEMAVGYAAMVF